MNEKFAALFAHPYSKNVKYCDKRQAFVYGPKNTRCKGLTKCLANAWILPKRHPTSRCTFCKGSAKRKRQAFAHAVGGVGKKNIAGRAFPSHKRQGKSAITMLPTEFGKLVDEQITFWTEHGARAAQERVWSNGTRGLLETSKTLMRHITETRKWIPVAAQVPILLASVGPRIATAIDLLCTDAETRRKLFLVEIKSTQHRQPGAADPCYRAAPLAPARVRDNAQALAKFVPRSQHATHQGQLWCMDWALRRDVNVTPDGAFVFRAGPRSVHEYALDRPWWDANCDNILLEIARPMLRKERAKRKAVKEARGKTVLGKA